MLTASGIVCNYVALPEHHEQNIKALILKADVSKEINFFANHAGYDFGNLNQDIMYCDSTAFIKKDHPVVDVIKAGLEHQGKDYTEVFKEYKDSKLYPLSFIIIIINHIRFLQG
jgi:hypothetical protein